MKVFVSGLAGFLGSHIAERYRDLGCQVVGIDNLYGGSRHNVPDGVRLEILDCLDRDSYKDILAGSDIVYHCAAAAYDGFSVFSPAYVYRNTVQATVEIASASIAADTGRFVFCSSMARYGALPAPFTESQVPRPSTPYGVAKYTCELLVSNLYEIHGGDYSIAIPHNIIGPRQRYDDPYRNVASIMINRMLQGLQPIIYGDGSHVRCFSFVDDVIYCLEKMGTSPLAIGEAINIGPDEGAVTILGLANEIASILDFDLDPIFVPERPREVSTATCRADKARRLLGYRTETTLRDGLANMVEWIERIGPRAFSYDLEIEIPRAITPATWTDKLI
ncbi:NAD-dependent epimerase/dehydratase family protein [Nocardiopsis flavescens]|uniref:NAD-dependent epimerase/dehydratase family protein n=1 Tax=Nocardiopsis flavescens TaxID=758803 RepID=UPI003654BC96